MIMGPGVDFLIGIQDLYIVDNKNVWEVDAWLMNGSSNIPDNCPKTMMTFDLTVRNLNSLKIRGTAFSYNVTRLDNICPLLPGGVQKVGADDIITHQKIDISRVCPQSEIKLSTIVWQILKSLPKPDRSGCIQTLLRVNFNFHPKVQSQIQVYSLLGQLGIIKRTYGPDRS